MAADLITLAQAKQYLQIPDSQTSDDDMIQALVDGASQEFLTLTSLPYIGQTSFTERRNGTGTASITMRNRPLQSITSLTINNVSVQASPDGVQAGYYFEPGTTVIYLVGGFTAASAPFYAIGFQGYPGRFTKGYGNVIVTGTAGYPNATATLNAVIPNPAPLQTVVYYTNSALVAADVSAGATVTYQSNNEPFVQIASGTPAQGEFVLLPDATFIFNAEDSGAAVVIAYSATQIPIDIQKCAYEMVGWAYKNRDRIGITSERFADNLSNSYSQMPYSPMSKMTIQRYTRKDAVGW